MLAKRRLKNIFKIEVKLLGALTFTTPKWWFYAHMI